MTSKFPDDNTEIEEETYSKKRARRVSFAEITAVHFFNRDEECETTPNNVIDDLNSNNGKLSRTESDEIMELLQSSSSSSSSDDDSNGGDDVDVDAVLKSSFLRPFESPSSASCFGSGTSNNEDDFFGVVSADFIRPGRLSSDSALCDDNHEVTMDSTAFSMNFRSLAKSESGGFKTPTGLRVPLGERSNCPASTASSDGNSMVLTGARETAPHSSLSIDKVNDSGNSDDMSLVAENRRIYDYGELPPELDVLLARGNKDVDGVPHYGDNKCSKSMNDLNAEKGQALGGRENFNLTEIRDAGSSHTTELLKTTGEAIFVNVMNVDNGNDDVADATLGMGSYNHSNGVEPAHDGPGPVTPSSNHNQASSFQDIPYVKDKEGGISSEVSKMFESPPPITQSQLRRELPIAGSISSILSKRRKIFKDSDELPQGDKEFHLKGTSNRGWTTSVFAKSVSRLKRIETSFHSDSKVEGNVSRLRASEFSLRSMGKDNTHVDAPVACLDARFAESNVSVRMVHENPKMEVNGEMLPKETHDLRDHAKANISEGQDGPTLHKLIGKDNKDGQPLPKIANIYGSDGPSSHERKFLHETEDHNDHAMSLQRKLKLYKDQENNEEEVKVSHCIESDLALRDWNDVFTSFCGVTKQLLAPMSDKLDVALIAKLDDILVHLYKSKSFELLHHEIALDSARFLDSKRVVHTKLLMCKAVCQKAKLQLMHLKKDKLADQASKMKSKVTESEKLMSNCYLLSKQGEDDHTDYSQLECHSTDTDNRSLVSAEISSLRKELEDSNGEIRKLNEFFYSRIKNKKELTSVETDASVKGLLKKMLACESRQSKMQLSKVEKLQAMNGQPNILFDHGGFILQSFIMNPTASSGLLLTNILNNENISKMFISNIEAYTAFSFVLSGDMQVKYDSLKTIAEQAQKTVSLLHTLLDVVGEVQLAAINHRSLTRSQFCKTSAGKLDLQLCFTDFKSGARVNLSIDMTCLNRGIYPSQVLPYEVTGITARNHDVFESLLSDIRTAVQGVQCGFWRILNICRCVARMVQDSKLVE